MFLNIIFEPMNRIFFTLALSFLTVIAAAQNYAPVDDGSKVHFVIKNFGINTGGDIAGLKGTILFDPANPASSDFNVSVDVNTIDTDSENRDEHLRSESYFDAAKYPVITIKSTKIATTNKTGSGWYYFTGLLTMHGVTKEISFPFTATLQGNNYLFAGEFELDRLNYAVGETSAVLSRTVKISLSVLARKS